ncbi:hypothetical protein L1987_85247 [Smallanthus sonchifolius]|uniref:Uncharacterized protein n=1 Tax=Smallanthus sonchifolius TaxID=185202 RepID=A0ACB8XX66_9ASTR|nr:hypothetical protein L1987_85247 [Smallanthus sonchifolius]
MEKETEAMQPEDEEHTEKKIKELYNTSQKILIACVGDFAVPHCIASTLEDASNIVVISQNSCGEGKRMHENARSQMLDLTKLGATIVFNVDFEAFAKDSRINHTLYDRIEVINQGPLVLDQKPAREITVQIDGLANRFRYANNPEAAADAVQRLWTLFKAIFDIRAWDTGTMESLCRACKHAVRTSKRFMGVTIGAMHEEIQGLYKQHHQSFFLYLSSEVIKMEAATACGGGTIKLRIFTVTSWLWLIITAAVAQAQNTTDPAEGVSLIPPV